uniref:vitamin-K-epoxide reductase (warfarin-sensitive) n=1 Tax=Neobodo designis TaxID=312471 RepID=A0A7S1Q904_NEODS|mmetsp:Transcript_36979/g.114187  ORF Transcript_36979/g.114187 Transcript_36979/m.114187 type:complete len:152 (+) Transcript_36979:299-754(+)
MVRLLPFVIAAGFLLAAYAFYVEQRFHEAQRLGTQYKALCDIGVFSCTKVFSSEFGYMTQFFGLPKISNAAVGMAFYAVEIAIEPYTAPLLLMSAASAVGSVGLFTILTVVMHDFCIVCFSIYVVNFITFFTALGRWRRARAHSGKGRKGQ